MWLKSKTEKLTWQLHNHHCSIVQALTFIYYNSFCSNRNIPFINYIDWKSAFLVLIIKSLVHCLQKLRWPSLTSIKEVKIIHPLWWFLLSTSTLNTLVLIFVRLHKIDVLDCEISRIWQCYHAGLLVHFWNMKPSHSIKNPIQGWLLQIIPDLLPKTQIQLWTLDAWFWDLIWFGGTSGWVSWWSICWCFYASTWLRQYLVS